MPTLPQQAGVIPFQRREKETVFCLITTSSGHQWTVPKGIIERGDSARETALKEAVEEAGLHGAIVGDAIGSFEQTKWGQTFLVAIYLMEVATENATWEEQGFRQRRWCDADTALALLAHRPIAAILRLAIEQLSAGPGAAAP